MAAQYLTSKPQKLTKFTFTKLQNFIKDNNITKQYYNITVSHYQKAQKLHSINMLKSHHTKAKALKYKGHLVKYLEKKLNKMLELKSLKYKLSTLSSSVHIEINDDFMSEAFVKITVKDPETLTTEFMKGIKQLMKLNNALKWELKETCTTITLTEEKLVHIDLVTE